MQWVFDIQTACYTVIINHLNFKQCFRAGFVDSGSWSRIFGKKQLQIRIQGLMPKKGKWQLKKFHILKKFTAEENFIFFIIKNCKLLIHRVLKRTLKLQERPWALKEKHPALQNMKFLFLNFLLFFWVIFAHLDLDSISGSTDLAESGTNPDPKHRS